MKLCRLCHARPAVLPDRNAMAGRPIKRVCVECHQQRLRDDLEDVILAAQERGAQRRRSHERP